MSDRLVSGWGDDETRYFFELTPDRVLEAVESAGFRCTGRCMALNSFENRVYDVELETDEEPTTVQGRLQNRKVVKFYRPGRWTAEQILEEHQFLADLVEAEIPAIAPLQFPDGGTLKKTPEGGIWYTIFPKVGGRAPDELSSQQHQTIGRLLARIHNVGSTRVASNRVKIHPSTYGLSNLQFLKEGGWLPLEFESRYRQAVESICQISAPWFEAAKTHRLHGDCHLGNLLWGDSGAFFLDFDDMVTGPAVQDLWLLLPERSRESLEEILEGYSEMRDFDRRTLRLIEPLRALRFVHYTAWIARRWQDPAFPKAFPHFNTHRYWSDETDDLEKQLRLVQESASFGTE